MVVLPLLLFLPMSSSFLVLPYVQVDFAHYFRIAQCRAKCAQKYATVTEWTRNDGTSVEFMEGNGNMTECSMGCDMHPRRGRARAPLPTNREDGINFWKESIPSTEKVGASPLIRVSLLCQNIAPFNMDSVQGLLGLEMKKHSGAIRSVVQWRQRSVEEGGRVAEESPAITASVEDGHLIAVEGMIPGIEYKFIVTTVGPNGRMGDPVSTDWYEAIQIDRNPEGTITVRKGYNSDDGVNGQISWTRSPADSCHYTLSIHNHTHKETRNITVDTSPSVLISNLEMDAEYGVSVSSFDVVGEHMSRPLTGSFRTPTCQEIHGKGTLNCAPDPVEDLSVRLLANGSALVSWKTPVNISQVLTYEVVAEAVSPCKAASSHVFLNGMSTSASIPLGEDRPCEYVIRVRNFDLLVRESLAETRLSLPSSLFLGSHWDGVIAASAVLLFLLVLILFLRCLHSLIKSRRNNEKKNNIVGFV